MSISLRYAPPQSGDRSEFSGKNDSIIAENAMRILIMAPVILAELLLAAGCTSLNWERPNTD